MAESATQTAANPEKGGRILRDRRQELDVTTSMLAAACNKTPTHISEIEHGRRTPSPDLLEAICDQLKLDGPERIDIFVLFGQMPKEVEHYIDKNRTRVIKSVQRMIAGDVKDGTWVENAWATNGSRNGAAKKKAASKKASKAAKPKAKAAKPKAKAAPKSKARAAKKKTSTKADTSAANRK